MVGSICDASLAETSASKGESSTEVNEDVNRGNPSCVGQGRMPIPSDLRHMDVEESMLVVAVAYQMGVDAADHLRAAAADVMPSAHRGWGAVHKHHPSSVDHRLRE